jgi:hypothetical protein
MADILTLAQARSALGWPDSQHQGDSAELTATYIPAVTEIISAHHTIPVSVPVTVVLVAKRLLARLWNYDQQGSERTTGTPYPPAQVTAEDLLLLAPYLTMDGFA